MANTFSNDIYHSTKTQSYLAIGLFAALIGSFLLMFILSFVQIVFTLPEVELDTGENVPVTYIVIGLVAILEILLRILTIIFFLIWLHRAYKNLPALGAKNLEFSPGWAVGWWFIPFANLVKPYQIMSELWNASDSDFDPELFLSNSIGTPSIISWWWGLFIIGNIVGRVADKLESVNLAYSLVSLIIYCALQGAAAFLIITIVRKITREQELRFQKLGALNQFSTPPPPPTFDNRQ